MAENIRPSPSAPTPSVAIVLNSGTPAIPYVPLHLLTVLQPDLDGSGVWIVFGCPGDTAARSPHHCRHWPARSSPLSSLLLVRLTAFPTVPV